MNPEPQLSERPATYYAPPELASPDVIARQHAAVSSNPLVSALLDSFPEPAAIVNAHRQIVQANDKLAALAGEPVEALLGQRVGKVLGCENAEDVPAGCGTTPACAHCGAAVATVEAQRDGRVVLQHCRIVQARERGRGSLDMRVSATPIEMGQERFLVFAVRDTSDEQRRRVLERMFFHDVLNAAGGLQSLLQIWPDLPPGDAAAMSVSAAHLAEQVVEEIQAQRDLAAAERGELTPDRRPVDVPALLGELAAVYRHHSAAEGREVRIVVGADPTVIVTDRLLLRRVLGNLVKNALEASDRGQAVTIRYAHPGRPVFEVHNQSAMPNTVRLQVFQRSFSTKQGIGRGVGTYSARLLTERYLGGRLTFSSTEDDGTTFRVSL